MLRHPQSGSYEALLPFAYQWFRWQTIAEAGLRRQKEAGAASPAQVLRNATSVVVCSLAGGIVRLFHVDRHSTNHNRIRSRSARIAGRVDFQVRSAAQT